MRKYITKVTICLWLSIFIIPLNLLAQEKPYREPTGLNNWYIELGGAAFLYSLNYEKILYRSTKLGWVGRVGVAYSFTDGWLLNKIEMHNGAVLAPFTTSVLLGSRERKEKIELGVGFTLVNKSATEREVVSTAAIGFRVIETNKVCFRMTYTPIIRGGKYENWFGVSIGRNFSMK